MTEKRRERIKKTFPRLLVPFSIIIALTAAETFYKPVNRDRERYSRHSSDVIYNQHVVFNVANTRRPGMVNCANMCLSSCNCAMFTYKPSVTSSAGSCRGYSDVTMADTAVESAPGARGFVVTRLEDDYIADPADCSELLETECGQDNGPYTLIPKRGLNASAYCNQTSLGGGWTVLLRRKDGSVTFDRDWADYVQGFGNPSGEFWLGLEAIYQITRRKTFVLRVDMTCQGKQGYAVFNSFRLENATDKYRLRLTNYNAGNMENKMYYNNGRQFGTRDQSNGGGNCPTTAKGGFWYNFCSYVTLTGQYTSLSWSGFGSQCTFAEAKMRPLHGMTTT